MGDMSENGLTDYVQRSSRALFAGNYAPEDALVFAQMSYLKFEKAYGCRYDGPPVPMARFADALCARLEQDDQNNRTLLAAVAASGRYNGCSVGRFAAENERSQWAAMTVYLNDFFDSAVIAMRGTDGTALGWTEDLQLLYEEEGTGAQKLSAEYVAEGAQYGLFLTGHSKGGNNVTSAFVMADAAVQEKIVRIDNFDGPGVNESFQERYAHGYARLAGRLQNFYPQDSVIGLLLNDNPGSIYYVESSRAAGILHEHDPYRWQFDGDGHFRYTRQSEWSKVIDEMLDVTVSALSQKERAALVGVLVKAGVPAAIAEGTWKKKPEGL